MRFTITPLGAAGGRTVDQVVDDIVRYLSKEPATASPVAGTTTATASYYSDDADGPGRWLGRHAARHGLRGDVRPEEFARVLAGRDPSTGERLITARGSAGRRPELGVGTATRRLPNGLRLYSSTDAGAALALESKEFEALVSAGSSHTWAAFLSVVTATAPPAPQPAGSYLVPIVEPDGTRWFSESELARAESARAIGPTREEISAGGQPHDQLPIADAARLAGVSPRYLRRLAKHWDTDRSIIEDALAAGRTPRRAFIVAYRGTRGQWLTTRRDLADFVARRTAPAVRVGFDLTLTTEKSLGVLALLGSPSTRRAVLDAIEAGNDAALEWWERRAQTRVGGEVVPAEGWMAASFAHSVSRRLDPFPHRHNVVANAVTTADGERRALDARSLYRHAVGASAIATVHMRHRLTATLGVRWRRRPTGGWEVAGISDAVLREFSQRRSEIDDAIAELEEAIGRARTVEDIAAIAKRTRPRKQHADQTELTRQWWDRARSHGLTPRRLEGCTGRGTSPSSPADLDEVIRRVVSPDGLTANASVFTRDDVLAALADLPVGEPGAEQPLLVTAAELNDLADRVLASPALVALQDQARRHHTEALYTTADMLSVQQRIVDRYLAGRHAQAAVAPPAALAAAMTPLSDEQAALVAALCGSGHRIQCAVGRAGSGKTTAMRAAAAAWQEAGYRVLGAAVKGDAARHLGAEANVASETLAWYLARDDPQRSPLDARTVLIVDEASTVSDRDLDKLSRIADATGAVLRLVGDPAQHGAVAAGGMFRVLCELHPHDTPQLSEHRRLQHPAERAAVDALRSGNVSGALHLLQSSGRLQLASDDVNLFAQLLTRWWQSRADGSAHPLVERSNHRRRQLNRLAHKLLQVHGDVGPDALRASDGRGFAVGDEVVARRGSRQLHPAGCPASYLRNGSRGTVTAAREDVLSVEFHDLGVIEIPLAFIDGDDGSTVGLDHGYATTSYAVQGATFQRSTSRVDERTSRAELYVDITRGRLENLAFATRAEDVLAGERLPAAPAPPLDTALTMRLSASGPEVTAWELAHRHRSAPSQDSERSTLERDR